MLLRLDGVGPRYTQITRALCSLIQSGVLAPGERLPPTRDLARDLSCSRNLVLLAYEQLTLEGYLTSRGGAGTFVSPDLPSGSSGAAPPAPAVTGSAAVALAPAGHRIAATAARSISVYRDRRPLDIDFAYGLFEPDVRMVAAIRSALSSALGTSPFGYPRARGDESLRRQLAVRLRASRGIVRTSEQVLITSGTQQALDVCTRLLVSEGDRVAIEDPTYDGANSVFMAAGAEIVRVPVDAQGIVVSALPDDGRPVRVVYVTPSHQFPTGAVMSAARRYALLAWAKRHGAFIFEDDYDSELRYTGRPIEALAALDAGDRVIYCGTFAKSLFPSLRLAYLSLPQPLMSAATGCKWLEDRGSPVLLQRMVGDLMASGEYDRHLRRTLRRYRARRDSLVDALRTQFGGAAVISGEEAGAHVVVGLPNLRPDRIDALVEACAARGVGVYPLGGGPAVHAECPLSPGLLLGYGLVDVDRVAPGIAVLSEEYRRVMDTVARGD